jgi:hypothetical protein
MRFSASKLLDIAAIPSIAASFQRGGIIARCGGTWIKKRWNFSGRKGRAERGSPSLAISNA